MGEAGVGAGQVDGHGLGEGALIQGLDWYSITGASSGRDQTVLQELIWVEGWQEVKIHRFPEPSLKRIKR